MTDIRMKECSGARRATKVRFIDKEREITIEGNYKSIYKACHNQLADRYATLVEDGEIVVIYIGKLDERSF